MIDRRPVMLTTNMITLHCMNVHSKGNNWLWYQTWCNLTLVIDHWALAHKLRALALLTIDVLLEDPQLLLALPPQL